MSRYLLDTNIISNATKPVPSEAVVAWMSEQADKDLYICSLTVAEIRRGILAKPTGKKRRDLEVWFAAAEGPKRCSAAACSHLRKGHWPSAKPARYDRCRNR